MGEIIPSESLSHVTYTGINSMHSQKTKQPYIPSARQNRTRKKKSAVEEDPRKSPEKIKKNEPLENLKSTESLKRERHWNKPPKRTNYIRLLRTEPLKTGRPKNKPELKKLATERIRALQTAQKTTTQEKSWVEDGLEKTAWKSRTQMRERRKQSF